MSVNSYSNAPTIDPKECEFFKRMSSVWWKHNILHTLSKIMIPFIQEGLINTGLVKKEFIGTSTPLRDIKILEVGCGGGILAEPLSKTGSTVVGLDVVPELINVAKDHAALDPTLTNLTYILESLEEHALNNADEYDAVVASDVIEHVNEQEIFLNACAKCLKPGGSVFVATLNKTTASWLGGIILLENVLNIIARGAHDWNKFISPEDVSRILEKGNCKTVDIRGLFLNVFNKKWSWMGNTSTFYALHAVKDIQGNS